MVVAGGERAAQKRPDPKSVKEARGDAPALDLLSLAVADERETRVRDGIERLERVRPGLPVQEVGDARRPRAPCPAVGRS